MGLLIVIVQLLSHVQLFCYPMDSSPPGSCVHGISQTRILEWVSICFSRGSYQPRSQTHSPALAEVFFTIKPRGIATICTEELMLLNFSVEEDS